MTTDETKIITILRSYITEWGTKPTAVELAGYETPDGVSHPALRTVMSTAQTMRSLHRRGLVSRRETAFGFIYAPSEIA